MAAAKRKMTLKAKVLTSLLDLLAEVLLAAVIYMNLRTAPEEAQKPVTTTTAVATTTAAPYDTTLSDKYAEVESDIKVTDITLEKDGHDVLSAFVDGKKAEDYTGVAKGEDGWYFVRNGEVDYNYTGIAANEFGKWYIAKGKADFSFSDTLDINGKTYEVVNGKVS